MIFSCNFLKNMDFETERLLIRPTIVEDASFFLKLMNTPQWIQNIGDRNLYSINDATHYILAKMIPQYQKFGYSNNTVILKSDNTIIGSCGLYKRDGMDCVDLGFAFLPEFQKKGYAYESSKKLVEMAFTYHNLDKLKAITIKENTNSQNLLTKLGFKHIGFFKVPDEVEDLLVFELENF